MLFPTPRRPLYYLGHKSVARAGSQVRPVHPLCLRGDGGMWKEARVAASSRGRRSGAYGTLPVLDNRTRRHAAIVREYDMTRAMRASHEDLEDGEELILGVGDIVHLGSSK